MTQSFARSQEGEVLLADHTREGIAILTARPSPLFRATLSTLFLLLLAGIGWSFFGHIDVIVRASGQLVSEERLVYAPIDGQPELSYWYPDPAIKLYRQDETMSWKERFDRVVEDIRRLQ